MNQDITLAGLCEDLQQAAAARPDDLDIVAAAEAAKTSTKALMAAMAKHLTNTVQVGDTRPD